MRGNSTATLNVSLENEKEMKMGGFQVLCGRVLDLYPSRESKKQRLAINELMRAFDETMRNIRYGISIGTKLSSSGPVQTCRGRAMFCSGSWSISCPCVIQPAVRAILKRTVNASDKCPHIPNNAQKTHFLPLEKRSNQSPSRLPRLVERASPAPACSATYSYVGSLSERYRK